VSIAAAQAVLDVIKEEDLTANAHSVGEYLMRGLRETEHRRRANRPVRGAGLFIGVDIVTDRDSNTPDGATAAEIVNALRDRRYSSPPPVRPAMY